MSDPVRDAFNNRKAGRVMNTGADGVATDGAGRVMNAAIPDEELPGRGMAPLPGGSVATEHYPIDSFDDVLRRAVDRIRWRKESR